MAECLNTYPSMRGASVSIFSAFAILLASASDGSPLRARGTPTPTPAVTATRNTRPISHQCLGLNSPGAESGKYQKYSL